MNIIVVSLYHETYDVRAVFDAPLIGDHADYYVALARRFGGPVLEMGAGTARIAKKISALGIDVTALELSDEMIDAGCRWGDPVPKKHFNWVRGDVRRLPEGPRYRLVIAPFRMLQELENDADMIAAIREAFRVLLPGGLFCFDMIDIETSPNLTRADPVHQRLPEVIHPGTGNPVRITACERLINLDLRSYRERWRFQEMDRTESLLRQEDIWQVHRWYRRDDIAKLLIQAGCRSTIWYGSFADLATERPRRPGKDQIWLCQQDF